MRISSRSCDWSFECVLGCVTPSLFSRGSTVTVSLGYSGVNGIQYWSSMSISTGEARLKAFHLGYGHSECTSSVGLMKWGTSVYEAPSAHC